MWVRKSFVVFLVGFVAVQVHAQDEAGTLVRFVALDLPHLINSTANPATGYLPELWRALNNTGLIAIKYPVWIADNFEQAARSIVNNQADVFLTFVEPSPKLDKSMVYTDPVMNTSIVLVYHKDKTESDKILYLDGTDAKDIMDRHADEFTPTMRKLSQAVKSAPEGLKAADNKTAFFLARQPFSNKIIRAFPNLKTTAAIETVETRFGVAKNNREVLRSMNAALYALERKGILEALRLKHFEGVARTLTRTKPKMLKNGVVM